MHLAFKVFDLYLQSTTVEKLTIIQVSWAG